MWNSPDPSNLWQFDWRLDMLSKINAQSEKVLAYSANAERRRKPQPAHTRIEIKSRIRKVFRRRHGVAPDVTFE